MKLARGWQQDGPAIVHEIGGWRIEPGWTGIGVELFERDRHGGWTVLLAFDTLNEAIKYCAQHKDGR